MLRNQQKQFRANNINPILISVVFCEQSGLLTGPNHTDLSFIVQ